MIYYIFGDNGDFSGTSGTETDRSTDVPPPELPAGHVPNWNGHNWGMRDTSGDSLGRAPITRLQFLNRFTDSELAAIYTAAKASVQVEIMLDKFKSAEFIALDDPQTVAGIDALETAGMIAAGRAAEILS